MTNIGIVSSANDSSNHFLQTVDSFIDSLNFQTSVQGLQMPNEPMQDSGMEFMPTTQGFEALTSGSVYATESNFYPVSSTVPSECQLQNYQSSFPSDVNGKVDTELLNSIADPVTSNKYDNDFGSMIPPEAYPPNKDIVAVAFEESGLLQATANVINAVKCHYKEKSTRKKEKLS